MLRSLIDAAKIARLRMHVAPEPVSQEEVSLIYNVFKHKCKELNEFNRQTMTSFPVEIDPMKMMFYRHNSGRTETSKFSRAIDMAFDLGGVESVQNVPPELMRDIYETKQKNLVNSMTKLKGIVRLNHYKTKLQAGDSSARSLFPIFKTPNNPDDAIKEKVKLMRSSLTKATSTKPYFDYKFEPDTDNFTDLIIPLDFNKNFEVRLIGAYFGEEAINVEEGLVDEYLTDRLLYGFDGFLSKRQKGKT